ncbi:hypothetical protein GCM10010096_30350 [Alcaligenes pakistanensis]|uniref:Uncharacterized protein n=1 Tax=Alcaligenes pakistanensis TaxID=1482717 RepID=A0A8H9IS46_9BURK|nr:hypothetical protein GCM10010096_30350 [Alcaligenes pakistanensis]
MLVAMIVALAVIMVVAMVMAMWLARHMVMLVGVLMHLSLGSILPHVWAVLGRVSS